MRRLYTHSSWTSLCRAALLMAGLVCLPAAARADDFATGFAALQSNDFFEARRRLAAASREANAGVEVWYHLGLAEDLLENRPAAVHAYARALELDAASPFAYRIRTNLGWARINAGDVPGGLEDLRAVAEARPDDYHAVANIAHAYFAHAEDFNAAETWYQHLQERFPGQKGETPPAMLWLREARHKATIVKIGTGFEVYRGDVVGGTFQGRNYGPAPDDHSIRFRTTEGKLVTIPTSEIRHTSREPKYKNVGAFMSHAAAERRPYRYDAILSAENLRQGQAALAAKQPSVAERQFHWALRKAPELAAARLGLATALYQQGAYARAVPEFEACTAQAETAAQAHHYLVSTYANHLNDVGQALTHALAYLRLPDAPQAASVETAAATLTTSLVRQNAGRPEPAWLGEVGLRLDRAVDRRLLGIGYLTAGQPAPALRHLGAAVELSDGGPADPALPYLEQCLTTLERQGADTPAVRFYRGYLQYSRGDLAGAGATLQAAREDLRARTLLALVHAYQQQTDAGRRDLDEVERNALPRPTQRLYDFAEALLHADAWYDRDLATREARENYARIGGVNGLGVYSENNEGDLMPIIIVARKTGHGRIEVNGNPMFDLFSIISFKESFDWVENNIEPSFPDEWETTITFGGLSLYLAKGGDSAGCAIALALASAVTQRPVLQDVAVTGAIRLDGRVEPVGAVPEKVLGAVAKDVRTIVLPAANLADLADPDPELCSRVKFVATNSVNDAVFHAFGPHNPDTAERYEKAERLFRLGCRYYRLGAYGLARTALAEVARATPENYSATRLLESMGSATLGPAVPGALGG